MKSELINRWLTLGANFGVLIGILLLVFELNQSRELVRSEIRNDLSVGVVDLLTQTARDEGLAELIVRGNSNEDLSAAELLRYSSYWKAVFRYAANVYYQYENGMYEDSEYLPQREAWRVFFETPAIAKIWCGYRETFADDVMMELDSLLALKEC